MQKVEKKQLKIEIDGTLKRRFTLALAKIAQKKRRDDITQTSIITAYIKDVCESQGV